MMRKANLAVLSLALLTAAGVRADAAVKSPAAKTQKLAFADVQVVFNGSEEAQAKLKALEEDFKKKELALKEKGEAFQKKVQEFQKTGDKMNETARAAKAEELGKEQMQLQQEFSMFEKLRMAKLQDIQQEMSEKIAALAETMRTEKGFDAVLPGPFLAVNAEYDLTADMTKQLNKQYDVTKKADKKAVTS